MLKVIEVGPSRYPDHTPPNYWKLGRILWMIFGNSDDPFPDKGIYPKQWSNTRKLLHWLFIRNPFHNFCFYVIGVADEPRTLIGLHPNKHFVEGFNFIITKYKIWLLPFISYQKTLGNKIIQFYLGWRPSGAFGFKLLIETK